VTAKLNHNPDHLIYMPPAHADAGHSASSQPLAVTMVSSSNATADRATFAVLSLICPGALGDWQLSQSSALEAEEGNGSCATCVRRRWYGPAGLLCQRGIVTCLSSATVVSVKEHRSCALLLVLGYSKDSPLPYLTVEAKKTGEPPHKHPAIILLGVW